jgi:hypothetical protein
MTSAITDEMLEDVLSRWDTVAYFAYDGYARDGRGLVAVEAIDVSCSANGLPVVLKYVIYDYRSGKPDQEVARLIEAYDPDWEIIIQYLRPTGEVRTMRLRTASGTRHPKRVWFFDTLGMLQEHPEDVRQPIPKLFWDFCEVLERTRKK